MIRPLKDRVFIRVEPEVASSSSIILVGGKDRMQRGTVLALGPKARRTGLEVGEVVVFGWGNMAHSNAKAVNAKVHTLFEFGDKNEYLILKDTDILMVLAPGYNPVLS